MQNRLQYNEAKDQADSLISQIKSGTMDSTQLATIMMGQNSFSSRAELTQTSESAEAPPAPMPVAPPMVVEAPPQALPVAPPAPAPPVMMMAPPAPSVMMAPPAPAMIVPTPAQPMQMAVKPTVQRLQQVPKQTVQSMSEVVEEKPVEMEDSISSIAQKVVEEKNQKQ